MKFFISLCLLAGLASISCSKGKFRPNEYKNRKVEKDVSIYLKKNYFFLIEKGDEFEGDEFENDEFEDDEFEDDEFGDDEFGDNEFGDDEFEATFVQMVSPPPCGAINLCSRICGTIAPNNVCEVLPVDQIISFWTKQINKYSQWEDPFRDLQLIARNPDVAEMLYYEDSGVSVIGSLLEAMGGFTSNNCPFQDNPYIKFKLLPAPISGPSLRVMPLPMEEVDQVSSPTVAVVSSPTVAVASSPTMAVASSPTVAVASSPTVAVASSPTVAVASSSVIDETQVKTIVEDRLEPFYMNVFLGFVKKCFADHTKTLSEMALNIENRWVFLMLHKALNLACHSNEECVRLAYCEVDSDQVWTFVKKKVQKSGQCGYDDFVGIPPQL